MESPIGVLFDLDGTLLDSVYQHVLAWHEALQEEGIELSVWRIHRACSRKHYCVKRVRSWTPPERRVCSGCTSKPTRAESNRCALCPAQSSCSVI